MPSGRARVARTLRICGCRSAAAKNRDFLRLPAANAMFIASAAAVASSSREALAISSPVRSLIMVWKFSSASSLPCEISGWYGV